MVESLLSVGVSRDSHIVLRAAVINVGMGERNKKCEKAQRRVLIILRVALEDLGEIGGLSNTS